MTQASRKVLGNDPDRDTEDREDREATELVWSPKCQARIPEPEAKSPESLVQFLPHLVASPGTASRGHPPSCNRYCVAPGLLVYPWTALWAAGPAGVLAPARSRVI